jgi:hypothetical protein
MATPYKQNLVQLHRIQANTEVFYYENNPVSSKEAVNLSLYRKKWGAVSDFNLTTSFCEDKMAFNVTGRMTRWEGGANPPQSRYCDRVSVA